MVFCITYEADNVLDNHNSKDLNLNLLRVNQFRVRNATSQKCMRANAIIDDSHLIATSLNHRAIGEKK